MSAPSAAILYRPKPKHLMLAVGIAAVFAAITIGLAIYMFQSPNYEFGYFLAGMGVVALGAVGYWAYLARNAYVILDEECIEHHFRRTVRYRLADVTDCRFEVIDPDSDIDSSKEGLYIFVKGSEDRIRMHALEACGFAQEQDFCMRVNAMLAARRGANKIGSSK